jgi:hypothetical protein
MDKIFLKIDRFSFKKITLFALLIGTFIMLPAIVWLSQQETRLGSKAAVEPTAIPTPIVYGNPPDRQPEIETVKPFVGKVGDEVVILGNYFGKNPKGAKIFFSGINVKDVISWEDGEIRFTIPQGAKSGSVIVRVGEWQVENDKPLTVYDDSVQNNIELVNNRIILNTFDDVALIRLTTSKNPQVQEYSVSQKVGKLWESEAIEGGILWIGLYDLEGQMVPFWVNPAGFNLN